VKWKCMLIYVSGGPAGKVGRPAAGSVSSIMRRADLASSNVAVHRQPCFCFCVRFP
jgi:hypothetical protein